MFFVLMLFGSVYYNIVCTSPQVLALTLPRNLNDEVPVKIEPMRSIALAKNEITTNSSENTVKEEEEVQESFIEETPIEESIEEPIEEANNIIEETINDIVEDISLEETYIVEEVIPQEIEESTEIVNEIIDTYFSSEDFQIAGVLYWND